MLTQQQIHELADLAASCRPHGAPQWDRPGIVAALRKVERLALPEVMRVVVAAAEDRSLRTPAVIGDLSAPVWRAAPPASVPRARVPRLRLCSTCSLPEPECRSRWAADHGYLSNEDLAAEVAAQDPLVRALRVRDLKRTMRTFGQIPEES